MLWTKFKVPRHFVVFSNTRLWEKETNMVVASHVWWLAKLAWYDVTRKPSIALKFFSTFGDRLQTLVRGGLMQKGGPLKFLTLVRGALKKISTDFPLKIEFTCFSMGLTRNFHGKKGGLEIFCGLKGGGRPKIFAKNNVCFWPPLQVFVNGPLKPRDYENTGNPESF